MSEFCYRMLARYVGTDAVGPEWQQHVASNVQLDVFLYAAWMLAIVVVVVAVASVFNVIVYGRRTA